MRKSHHLTRAILTSVFLMLLAAAASAQPGQNFPASSEVSDQKAGSVLVYNIYTSSAVGNAGQSTKISIANTSTNKSAFVHLFFINSADCAIADSYICLTPNQKASFQAADVDPGVKGYLIAVAVDKVTGCPTSHNFLIGDEYVKFATGHSANLGAEAFSALYTGNLPGCDGTSFSAVLNFDGSSVGYNQLPRVLAASDIPSRVDGNDTMIIINRIGGDLSTGAASLGTLFGVMYDDAENAASYQLTGTCQLMGSFSNSFPRMVPRLETFIPSGRSGWTKIYNPTADIGMLGAVINYNPNSSTQESSYTGGHNLHKLKLAVGTVVSGSSTVSLTVPVFPPGC